MAESPVFPDNAPWQVFVSHTSELRDFPGGMSYVGAVERAISAAGHVIVDMAGFAASARALGLQLLRGLTPEQRTVAALFYDGLTASEIASLTGKPAATVRSHLRHARNCLKEMIMPGRLPPVGTSP